jgi:oligoribonuclease
MLAWIDTETSGLDPDSGWLLEVAMLVTDDALNEVAHHSVVIQPPGWTTKALEPFIFDMHSKNGLIEEIESGGAVRTSLAATGLCEFYEDVVNEPVPMCGSTIGFDRAWLKAWMPEFESMFHYRSIDVSTIKETARRFAPGVAHEWAEQNASVDKPHRALADIRESLEEYRFYVTSMRNSFWMHPADLAKKPA